MNSILTEDNECCYLCNLEKRRTRRECVHHIFGGPLRSISERMGFKVPLCNRHHNMSDIAVHFNRDLDLILKRLCQAKFEETHSRQEFMRLIGRNYLSCADDFAEEIRTYLYTKKLMDGGKL